MAEFIKSKEKIEEEKQVERYKRNCKKISSLLNQNEFIHKAVKNTKLMQNIEPEDHINFPKNSIGKIKKIKDSHKFTDLPLDIIAKSNISYLIQYNDFIKYMLANFNIYGSLEKAILYHGIINNFSIYESILINIAKNYRSMCANCKLQSQGCNDIINSDNSEKFNIVLDTLEKQYNFKLKNNEISNVDKIKKIRNYVHLYLQKEVLCNDKKISRETYNLSEELYYKILDFGINNANFMCNNIELKVIKNSKSQNK